MIMAGAWPFGKKNAPPEPELKPKKEKVVEYERKPDTAQKEMGSQIF